MKVVASEWCRNPMQNKKIVKEILGTSEVQRTLLSAALKMAAQLTAKLGTHTKSGTLAGSVSTPQRGKGRSVFRWYVVIGKGVPYVLAHEHGRKTNGAYEGFHEIESELSW